MGFFHSICKLSKKRKLGESGQGIIEYGLLLILVAVVSVFILGILSDGVRTTFRRFIANNPAPPPGVAPIGGQFAPRIPTPTPLVPPPNPLYTTNPLPAIIQNGQTIQFTDQSIPGGGTIVQWSWDFGDGNFSTDQNPSHTYSTAEPTEIFEVELTVIDDLGNQGTIRGEVGVENGGQINLSPISLFSVAPDTSGEAPFTVQFTSQATDPDNDITTYRWLLDDNGIVPPSSPSLTYTYDEPGIYYPRLEVTDSAGNVSTSDNIAITVQEPPRVNQNPSVVGAADVTDGYVQLSVTFSIPSDPTDLDGSVETFWWDFGDGGGYPETSVSGGIPIIPYIYQAPGVYTATVSVRDNEGGIGSDSIRITVNQKTCDNNRVKAEFYMGINGAQVNNLINADKYPDSPDEVTYYGQFEGPTNYANNYGTRYTAFLLPPVTGDYTFYVAGDGRTQLYLSTNNSTGNKRLIAEGTTWTDSREWTKRGSQQSTAIRLESGQFYYIEALHKERRGNDNFAVGWTLPGESTINVIPGNNLCTFD